ncbi:MAG TPA: MGMT family protein [Nitrososphaera sp.]|jgi:methylated-DNA-[protein]-cysteine S-methyltransferase|nr:MGMT family protein [Thermoproteota archaeon]HZA47697.1 MGMT family protein [Nitrososphaera sp.]
MNLRPVKASHVYEIVAQIPEGKVTTYGDIAKALGHPGASRVIGRILNKNPNPILTPCHRVIKSNGNIGGYAFGKTRKKELLKKEGLRFIGDSTAEFAKYRISLRKLTYEDLASFTSSRRCASDLT